MSPKLGTKLYTLIEDFDHPAGFRIPAPYDTNGASIPRLLWTVGGITPYDPALIAPALSHDFLFEKDCPVAYTFEEANELFRVDLLSEGNSEEIVYLMYNAIQMFGRSHFRQD